MDQTAVGRDNRRESTDREESRVTMDSVTTESATLGRLKYEGKGKRLFSCDQDGVLIQQFKDDATAFDGKKHDTVAHKGELNCAISAFFFTQLTQRGIRNHMISRTGTDTMSIYEMRMFPVEVVVRNVAAGSICRRLGLQEGAVLKRPLTELFYKSDQLGDPMINSEHADLFGWATINESREMRATAVEINRVLIDILQPVGIRLIDFKLEFGRLDGAIVLGDEITPDGCRLWDIESGKKLDKDRFRQDLGGLTEAYSEVANRLHIATTQFTP
ncbi:MAG: phosphoribosylaminoimidazolesuccinocarboxamide synthase [Mariprofundales bacterium]|nr:phosphoribosylaminoimidazolesuccinocarboxamide synthase [Mariprofundales bacterium]